MRMRKAIYRGSNDEGLALLARARDVQLAMVSASGVPILRTVNAVVVDGALAFHGAPAGEKMEGVGRAVVAGTHETVASIPSYFLDPERACPATTYYLSVQAEGVLELVTDPGKKARVLAALMAKYQPEGGHVPLAADHPLYAKAIAGLLVAELRLDRVACKAKLGQNRPTHERLRVVEQLWARGAPGDVEAVAMLLARCPELGTPDFLRPREDLHGVELRLQCHVGASELDEAVRLLDDAYWLDDVPRHELRTAIASSSAVVAARDEAGTMVAFARAVSDGKCAWIYDVVVAPQLRAARVGSAVMALLLDHPAVRRARHVRVTTRDAMRFYERLGFANLDAAPRHGWTSTDLIRRRAATRSRLAR